MDCAGKASAWLLLVTCTDPPIDTIIMAVRSTAWSTGQLQRFWRDSWRDYNWVGRSDPSCIGRTTCIEDTMNFVRSHVSHRRAKDDSSFRVRWMV